jgi:hypothetical protein
MTGLRNRLTDRRPHKLYGFGFECDGVSAAHETNQRQVGQRETNNQHYYRCCAQSLCRSESVFH